MNQPQQKLFLGSLVLFIVQLVLFISEYLFRDTLNNTIYSTLITISILIILVYIYFSTRALLSSFSLPKLFFIVGGGIIQVGIIFFLTLAAGGV